jgi:hypothetical protein
LGAETHLTVADRRWLSPLSLWTGILAGPVAWAIDLEASYALVRWTCATRRVEVLHAISLLALLITAGGIAISWIALQHTRQLSAKGDDEIVRARFMAILGLSTGVLFVAAIIAGAIPRWVLDACQ